MYIPAAFHQANKTVLFDFIEQNSFGILVSHQTGELSANHLPFLLDRENGPHGTLLGHMARANPQWHDLRRDKALVIFPGPHAYISPSWYRSQQSVPTWNFLAVHASGTVTIIEEGDALLAIVQQMVGFYENKREKPWSFDGTSIFIQRLLTQIVGIRIEVEKLDGKWKLSQNQPLAHRRFVAQELANSQERDAQMLAQLMQAQLDRLSQGQTEGTQPGDAGESPGSA